jgi:hypothetical protein
MIESYETACHVYSGDEPLNQRQALKRPPDAAEWREAEEAEMRQLTAEGMDCYVLLDRAEAESAVASGEVPKIYRSRFKPQYAQLPDDWKDRYPGKVIKISKALYGSKFSPQVFHKHLCSTMGNFQCMRADGDGSVLIRREELGVCIVAAWVDDLTVFGDTAAVNRFRQQISDVEHGGFFTSRITAHPPVFSVSRSNGIGLPALCSSRKLSSSRQWHSDSTSRV